MEFDLILSGGRIIDGTGGPWRAGDVGVSDGRIEVVDDLSAATAPRRFDASGKVVAPGFIDVHSHSDFVLPLEDHGETLAPFLLQGVTTMVTGNCGFAPAPASPALIPYLELGGDLLSDRPLDFTWNTMAEFLDTLEERGVCLNVAQLVGHGVLRLAVLGTNIAPPTAGEMTQMRKMVAEALDGGAVGLSAGLGYAPGMFAPSEELVELCREAASRDKPFTCHARAYTWIAPNVIEPTEDDHHVAAIKELMTVAEAAGVSLQISHLMFAGEATWERAEPVFDLLDNAEGRIDYALDLFPYTAGNTTIRIALPPWMQGNPEEQLTQAEPREQVREMLGSMEPLLGMTPADLQLLYAASEEYRPHEGQTFAQIGEARGEHPYDVYMDVVVASRGSARIMIHKYSGTEEDHTLLHRTYEHPGCAVGADSILTKKGFANPASYGCFPRVLGTFVRDRKLFSLEEAVRRMTSLPAERVGLGDRGRIAPGFAADLVVFDAETIADRATFEQPTLAPVGIEHVFLNGVEVVSGGATRPQRAGRVLRT